jgi:hypothetical protein
MLDPGYNLARITVKRRQPNKWFRRGTLYRRALDVLRTAAGPMTTAEIGEAVLKAEGIEATKADAQAVALSIQHNLKSHEEKGVKIDGEARPARWALSGMWLLHSMLKIAPLVFRGD